ncbi:DUF4231 domain-containing protein [Occultella kanbiaonis]|uniref:DUF4231 domain-containing protein n=1 Tax=Occultella kanbiaonis TaxID=2675754 RepID=UPI0012B95D6A|nr:DUF4231 domain-containing protein [Occultella kanbiaonis]
MSQRSEPSVRPPGILRDEDLSGVVAAADDVAVRSQTTFVRGMRVHYTLLVLAALCGTFSIPLPGSGADIVAVLGAVCFGASLLLRVYLNTKDSESHWLRARSVAESAKADSWRFAVQGAPFGPDLDGPRARRMFLAAQNDEIADLGVTLATHGQNLEYVTRAMSDLREADFATRRDAYITGRIVEQMTWYARKSRRHGVLADRWFLAMLLAEAAGLAAAVLKAANIIDLDLLGVFGALAAVFGAWSQMRQHRKTHEIYGRTASHLATLVAWTREGIAEADWTTFVARAEAVLADELTTWQSLRTAEPGRTPDESVG